MLIIDGLCYLWMGPPFKSVCIVWKTILILCMLFSMLIKLVMLLDVASELYKFCK